MGRIKEQAEESLWRCEAFIFNGREIDSKYKKWIIKTFNGAKYCETDKVNGATRDKGGIAVSTSIISIDCMDNVAIKQYPKVWAKIEAETNEV